MDGYYNGDRYYGTGGGGSSTSYNYEVMEQLREMRAEFRHELRRIEEGKNFYTVKL